MDLVIQSKSLPAEAIEAFRAACLAPRLDRRPNAARLMDVPDDADTRRIAAALAAYWKCDAAFVKSGLRSASYRLLVMDMDSTLVTIEGIDELARLAGKGPQVAAITAAAMRGEIAEYAQSLRDRVALLAGADAVLLQKVIDERLKFSDGAALLLAGARARGWQTLLVSGGFTAFADRVRQELGIDESWANALEINDGRLTGAVHGPAVNDGRIVDGAAKARALRQACAALGCSTKAAVAVGDGANDLEMMAAAGISVAYRAKPLVREHATCTLDHTGLDGILELFTDGWKV